MYFIKLILIGSSITCPAFIFGQEIEKHNIQLVLEKINYWKIKGKNFRHEPLCSRKYKIKMNHVVKYSGGCEGNVNTIERGIWKIKNDTLIISNFFNETKKWILVKGCLCNISYFNHLQNLAKM